MGQPKSGFIAALSQKAAWHVVPVLAALAALALVKELDTRYYPVVDVPSTHLEGTSTYYTLSGTLDKHRDCRFIELVAYVNGQQAPIQFLDAKVPYSRVVGLQTFGPWEIDTTPASGDLISVTVRHSCHSLWEHTRQIIALRAP